MNIRYATVDDAKRLAALILQVESESDYLLFEAGERKLTPEQQRSHLEAITNEDNATILLAEMDEGELVGYLLARGGICKTKPTFRLHCHRAACRFSGKRSRHDAADRAGAMGAGKRRSSP